MTDITNLRQYLILKYILDHKKASSYTLTKKLFFNTNYLINKLKQGNFIYTLDKFPTYQYVITSKGIDYINKFEGHINMFEFYN